MGARYYAPYIGRLLSRDPIGFDGGINVYGYCAGDPISYVDPLGLDFAVPWFGGNPLFVFSGPDTLDALNTGCQAARYGSTFTLYRPDAHAESSPYFSTSAWVSGVGTAPLAFYVAGVGVVRTGAALVRVGAARAVTLTALAANRPDLAQQAVQKGGTLGLQAADDANPWMGTISSSVAQESQVACRIWGGGARLQGSWLTPTMPRSAEAARMALSLPPDNSARYVSEVVIPAETRIQTGIAAGVPAWGTPGGGVQTQLLQRLPATCFEGPRIPLR